MVQAERPPYSSIIVRVPARTVVVVYVALQVWFDVKCEDNVLVVCTTTGSSG